MGHELFAEGHQYAMGCELFAEGRELLVMEPEHASWPRTNDSWHSANNSCLMARLRGSKQNHRFCHQPLTICPRATNCLPGAAKDIKVEINV